MKKILLTLALVAGASFVQAADTYMYWMLDVTPTAGNPSSATYKDYYARVKVDGGTYLNFYEGGVSAGDTLYAESSALPYQMLLSTVAADYTGKSFIIELWNDDALTAGSEASFRTELAWADVSKYITTGSAEHITPGMVSLGNFSAVPEPTSGMMMLLGAMLLGLKRKKLA